MKTTLKVLIVEDDKNAALALGELVKRLGFKPMIIHKSQDALNLVRMQTVNAAIVDVLLPKMTGVELANEFRKTKFGNNPVIFVSGVFKDKSFVSETLKKTEAVDFLLKPYSNDEMLAALTRALEGQGGSETVTVQSLLTRKLNSDRERAKAIENMEQIKGLEFPFVVSILMEAGSSGHLNIVNDTGEIFGVTLVKGAITEFDGAESQSEGVSGLIAHGFLNQEDWAEFQKNLTRKFSLDKLVQESYVSPHAVSGARRDLIMQDIRALCLASTMRVNFVNQESTQETPRHAVSLTDMLKVLDTILHEHFTEAYLKEFYAGVTSSGFRLICTPAQFDKLWQASPLKGLEELKSLFKAGETIEELLANTPDQHKARVYQGLHYFVVARAVLFEDAKRTKQLTTVRERYQKLYDELKDRTPDKIFEYFGATANSPDSVINNLFQEYSKSNNPDQLGNDIPPDLRELCTKCFDLVNNARDILTDDKKKLVFLEQVKAEAAQKQAASQQLTTDGWEALRQGKAADALAKFREATRLAPSNRLIFYTVWAEIKSGAAIAKPRLAEMLKQLDSIPAEERKVAPYHMALGLAKKAAGDTSALASFEKALQFDPQFVEARRELNPTSNTGTNTDKAKKLDFFNDDITTVVSQIFRRKAE